MANKHPKTEQLGKKFNEMKPEEHKAIASKGGIATGIAQAKERETMRIAKMLVGLPLQGANKEKLLSAGVPEGDITQMTALLQGQLIAWIIFIRF